MSIYWKTDIPNSVKRATATERNKVNNPLNLDTVDYHCHRLLLPVKIKAYQGEGFLTDQNQSNLLQNIVIF